MERSMLTILSMLVLAGTAQAAQAASETPPAATKKQVVEIVAKKFAYLPNQITVHKGQPVVLKLTTQDRSHGFNLPDLHVRTDIQPGKVTEVEFTPTKSGEFDFYCDIFCGSGHPDMDGKLKVID
ncbi:MAG TPA: cupredoxin domain-containing protein [Candidatus Obscuribacterales bacterium]